MSTTRAAPVRIVFSSYYFASISIYAFTLGYLPLHCEHIGFTAAQIAAVSAVANIASILASPTSLQLAHRLIPPRSLITLCLLVSVVAFLPLGFTTSFYVLIFAWVLSCFCKRAGDALIDAQAIRSNAEGVLRFERVRSWGSIGFVVAMVALGASTDIWGRESIVLLGFAILLTTLLTSWFIRPYLRAEAEGNSEVEGELVGSQASTGYKKQFAALLISVALVWASHSILYVYLSLYLDALGWSATEISIAWNIGVVAEILFFFAVKYLERFMELKTIYLLSIFACLLRWLVLYFTDNFEFILLSQVLHGLSFGACYVASMKLTHTLLPERLKDRGQGLLYGFGIGTGALLGRLHAGYVASDLESYRGVQDLFLQSFLFSLLALAVAYLIQAKTPETA